MKSALSTKMTELASAILFFLLFGIMGAAQQVPDFSGTYFLKSTERSDSRNKSVHWDAFAGKLITKVVQDSNSVEIVFRSKKGLVTYRYGLDGSETRGTEEDGTPTVERVEMKGKNLIIRSRIEVATGALKGVPVQRTQRWQLSKDLKTLTVREQIQVQGDEVQDDLQTATYLRR